MVRTGEEHGKIEHRQCSTLAGSALFKGDMKRRRAILMLISLYIEWETCLLL
jgi:hypothetical protein